MQASMLFRWLHPSMTVAVRGLSTGIDLGVRRLVLRDKVLLEEELLVVACVALPLEVESVSVLAVEVRGSSAGVWSTLEPETMSGDSRVVLASFAAMGLFTCTQSMDTVISGSILLG